MKYICVYYLLTALVLVIQAIPTPGELVLRQLGYKVDEGCYGELGCYNPRDYKGLLLRKISVAPNERSKVNTKFALYTRQNKPHDSAGPHYLKINDTASVSDPKFDASKPIKFIVHGFIENGLLPWVLKLANELLEVEDVNVIAIDWSGGNDFPYFQAVSNTWIVGGDIWLLCKFLKNTFDANINYDNIHIIGHSLGSQIAANAGYRMEGKLGRISALDPAGPDFENLKPEMRLDESDAKFVDVIHTDSGIGGLGMKAAAGHMDFYLNEDKPEGLCKASTVIALLNGLETAVSQYASCKHQKSVYMYIESIRSSCPFLAHKCSSFNRYMEGSCASCGSGGKSCAKMGYHSNSLNTTGTFYLSTALSEPFCFYHYSVEVVVSSSVRLYEAIIDLTLEAGNTSMSLSVQLGRLSSSAKYKAERKGNLGQLGKVTKATLKWNKKLGNIIKPTINIEKIIVEPMDILSELARVAEISVLCNSSPLAAKAGEVYTITGKQC